MSEFAGFDALSFDCYGTLIDWEAGIAEALERWAAGHGVTAPTDELVAAFAAVETEVQSEHPATLYPEVLALALPRIAARFGAEATPEDARAFGASVGDWPAFADSADALARLAERFKLIILSNVDRESFARSNRRLGVEFDLIVTAQDVGAYKPSPSSFPAMLARLGDIGVERGKLLHVAQSLYHDHEPAAAVGLPSVWIDRRHDQGGYGATPPPQSTVEPRWRFPTMVAFADAALSD
ncbi:MAG TPA: HAD-IA family hydrolase [Acidimicrobiia bacterium]|jgi:2-haloalkanoic acid dehalogenase type II|nr:HAD-IA family hydrolase [Acidimicrobiia bacterium]